MRIEVELNIDTETKDVYGFTLIDGLNVVFTSYHREIKPKGKRIWKIIQFWDKYSRESNIEQPELPQNVRDLAFEKVITLINIKT